MLGVFGWADDEGQGRLGPGGEVGAIMGWVVLVSILWT